MAYQRIYTFHVKGISIIDYTRPNKHNVVTLNYKRTYKFSDRKQRPTNGELWAEFRGAIMGHPIIENAWVHLILAHETEPGVQSVTVNEWAVKIPRPYEFDGVMG